MNTPRENWVRARTPEQKEFRTDEILQSADKIFQEKDFEEISLNEIARGAGISKPNIYRYFLTKEDIFLRLVIKYFDLMLDYQAKNLSGVKKGNAKVFASAWAKNTMECERFLRLVTRLGASLERYSSEKGLFNYKSRLFPLIEKGAEIIQKYFPDLSVTKCQKFIYYHYGMSAGLMSLIKPSANLQKTMAMPEFKEYKLDGEKLYVDSVYYLLDGLVNKG
ncbi:TetR family transcriptional regulator [Sedimentisphaera salicampi]|uniref:HTH-type transcriptional regulator EthR n=1 Tax=Sedimentisphaera salicampi TaxID=1941349 RepID=A0A1W6LJG2_9BACT|nr:TetR family transcriptional regulator [Sedimentisphaera salicampi]ARN55886.1 HTH-type transcriptional regulator EthR [Sedimentisphaera salicampi]OXU16077.1 HTH-type transcriptional regulator EthR [Sedimentisphaera salicampi]